MSDGIQGTSMISGIQGTLYSIHPVIQETGQEVRSTVDYSAPQKEPFDLPANSRGRNGLVIHELYVFGE